jgi:hypothetical protein
LPGFATTDKRLPLFALFQGRTAPNRSHRCSERRLDRIAAIDCYIPVKNFLQDFGVRHQNSGRAETIKGLGVE